MQKYVKRLANARYSALTFQGGHAWREAMLGDVPPESEERAEFESLLASYSDDALQGLMTNLGWRRFYVL